MEPQLFMDGEIHHTRYCNVLRLLIIIEKEEEKEEVRTEGRLILFCVSL